MAEELINRKFDLNDKAEAVETPKSEPEAASAPAAPKAKTLRQRGEEYVEVAKPAIAYGKLAAIVIGIALFAGMFLSLQEFSGKTEKYASKSAFGRFWTAPPTMTSPLSTTTRGLLK
jgi:hypothetical protein